MQLTALELLKFYREVPVINQYRNRLTMIGHRRTLPDLPEGYAFLLNFLDDDNPSLSEVTRIRIVDTETFLELCIIDKGSRSEDSYAIGTRCKKALTHACKVGFFDNLPRVRKAFITMGWTDQLLQN